MNVVGSSANGMHLMHVFCPTKQNEKGEVGPASTTESSEDLYD
jgi:hypothetical protein